MKRIVEETLRNGVKHYRVESNRILWIIPWRWHTISYISNHCGDKVLAVFNSLSSAQQVLQNGKLNWQTDVIERIIVKEQ